MKTTEIHKWSVAWICSFINFLYLGLPRLSGMFYLAAITRYNVSRNQAALPFVLCYTVRNVAGPFIGCLSRKVKVETLILSGCLLSSVGVGVCFFAEDINTVSVLWGGVFGLGFGLSTILIPSVLNQHFDKYISNANGIAFGGECIAGFVLPPLYEFCLNTFGPSGSFLILSGLLLHGIPAAMLLKPPAKKSTERNRDDAEWGSWGSIDKAGCSGSNVSKKGKHEDGLSRDANEVKSLLDESKNCYGTSDVAIAVQKDESDRYLDRSKLGYKYVPSDQYVVLSKGVSSDSKFPSCSRYDEDLKKFHIENGVSTAGDVSGVVQDVIVVKEASVDLDSSCESQQTRTAVSCDFIPVRTRNEASRNTELSLRTKSLSVSSDSFSYHKTNLQEAIQAAKPKETDKYEHCKGTSQNSIHERTNESSGVPICEKIVTEHSNESDQVEISNEASQKAETSLRKRLSSESIQKEDSKASKPSTTDQTCNEVSQNIDPSLLQGPSGLTTRPHNVSTDWDKPIPRPRLPSIPDQSEISERPCCPTACSVFLDPAFLLILFTQSSSIFVATTFTTILVEFSIDAGVDPALAVYVLMVFSAADMAGRFGLGWVTDGAWLSGVAFSALCFSVMGAVLLSAPVAYQGFGLVAGAVGVYGALLGGLIIIGPVVVTEHIQKEAVNVALASRLTLFAPMSLVQSSMIGYFRDTLGSYNGILYLLGAHCIVCAVLCLLIPSATRCRKIESRESAVTE